MAGRLLHGCEIDLARYEVRGKRMFQEMRVPLPIEPAFLLGCG